jgi:hypothetical protein
MVSELRLTRSQIDEVIEEKVETGHPVRFLHKGHNLDIVSGNLLPRGTVVMHQVVYWNFTKETSKKIAKWLGATPVFSE